MATPLNNSILKGFEVLDLFSRDRPEVSAAHLVSELEMTTATAHRLLATLEEAGAIVAVRRGSYRLGPVLAELGRVAEETNPISRRIQPILDHLAADLGESVMVCRLARRGPTCIAVANPDRPFAMGFRTGQIVSLGQSAQGRLYLAAMSPKERAEALAEAEGSAPADEELDRIRAQGFAENRGDVEGDVGAVAVPVQHNGAVALTLSTFGPLGRFTDPFRARALPALTGAAREIAAALAR